MKKFLLLLSFLSLSCLNVNTVFAQNGERNILNNETSSKNHLNIKSLTKFKNTKISLEKVADGIAFVPNILSLVAGTLTMGVGVKNGGWDNFFIGISFISNSINNLLKTRANYKNVKDNENQSIISFIKDSVITVCSLISITLLWNEFFFKRSSFTAIVLNLVITLPPFYSLWHTLKEGKKVYQTIKISKK